MQVHLTKKSSNVKTGKIPVSTTEQSSCPDTCPFNHMNEGGCYAGSGPLKLHWDKVSNGERGMSWDDFCSEINELPKGQLWRHNQAGDLPHKNGRIRPIALGQLINANEGKRGFTYTHHDVEDYFNAKLVEVANREGFTINLSGNNLDHADSLMAKDIGPVTSVVPSDYPVKGTTKAGNKVITCPATYRDNVSCETCKLCSIADRDFIIAFPAHGTSKKKANKVALGE